jgi:hypothetical protein
MYQPSRIVLGIPRNPEWDKVRNQYLKNHNRCVVCSRATKLNVHHIRPYHLYHELELDPTNLITLCENTGINCHFVFGHLGDWTAYNPNVIEDTGIYHKKIEERYYI